MSGHEEHPAEPEAATGELGRRCSLCQEAIADAFFTLRGLLLCPGCASAIVERQGRHGSRHRATLYGLAAATIGATLWFLATRASGWPLSVLAVFVGAGVGMAVHQGSGGSGGLRFQITAALLVYAAFVLRAVPPIFGGIAQAIEKEHAASVMRKGIQPGPGQPESHVDQAGAASAPARTGAVPAPETISILTTVKAYFVFTLVAWGLVLASPFMQTTSSLFGTLCLALGIAIAWRLNRRVRLAGPFTSAG